MTDQAPLRGLRVRLISLVVLLSVGFGGLGWRLYSIQIGEHERYLLSAENMHRKLDHVYSNRGDIYSVDGVLVARDVLVYEIGVDPAQIQEKNLQRAVNKACQVLGTSSADRRERVKVALEKKKSGKQWVFLARDVEEVVAQKVADELAKFLSTSEQRGLVRQPYTRRHYPRGEFMASVIGVTDHTARGIEGLERSMDEYLRPQDGRRWVRQGARQKNKLQFIDPSDGYVAPAPGYTVYSTIESRIQALVERKLAWGVKRMNADGGVAIVMDCQSGKILALANYPTYDPNRFEEYSKQEREKRRKNRAVEDTYEPGSVMKPFMMSAVLEHNLVSTSRSIRSLLPAGTRWDGGSWAKFGSRIVRDVHANPTMTVEEALFQSSNIGMSAIGLRLGRDRIVDMMDSFKVAARTGIRLPAEAKGKRPARTRWKPYQETISVSYGYAVTMTPLQIIRGFAALVNGGDLLQPYIVDRIEHEGKVTRVQKREVLGRPVSEETSRRIRDMLRKVVQEGTANFLDLEEFPFGGKTGTAKLVSGGRYTRRYLASFEAFAPFDDPKVAILVMIERPRKNIYGSIAAGPVVVEVIRGLFNVEGHCKLASFASWNNG